MGKDISTAAGNLLMGGKPADTVISRARLDSIDADGSVFVVLPQGSGIPVPAHVTMQVAADLRKIPGLPGREVIVLVDPNDDAHPVIIGLVSATIQDAIESFEIGNVVAELLGDQPDDVLLEAPKSLTLNCGKARITLRENGEIVIRGTKLTSRASVANRVRGATVEIN